MNPGLPSLPEDERFLLGALMMDPSLIQETLPVVGPGDFTTPIHANLYRFMLDMHEAGTMPHAEVVFLTVLDLPKEKQQDLGGFAYVTQLPGRCPSVEGAPAIAKKLKAVAVRRDVILGAMRLIRNAEDSTIDTHTLTAQAELLANEIGAGAPSADWATLDDAVEEALIETLKRSEARFKGEDVGIPTGIPELDTISGPLEPGQLWVIAGRPGMGKSALGLQIALDVAKRGYGVALVSMEMSRVELAKRQLSAQSGVFSEKIRDGKITDYDYDALVNAQTQMRGLPVWIQDDTGSPIALLRSKVKRLKVQAKRRGVKLALLVVDYLQLVEGQKGQPREQAIAATSRALKALAMDEELTVFAVSQLNRDCENRGEKRPVLSDLRESGAIEQDANKVLTVYRDEVYKPGENVGKAEIAVLKNREGSSQQIAHVLWDGPTTSFRSSQ